MKEIVLITGVEEERPLARHCKPMSEKSSTSRRFWKVKERDFPLLNPEHFEVGKGDYVEVELPPGEAIKSAFLLFILPILIFLVIYGLTSSLGQAVQIPLSLAGLVGGFFIPLVMKRLGRQEALPFIIKKLSLEAAKDALSCDIGCAGCGGCG